jgi:YVTN family beta-propeller protein
VIDATTKEIVASMPFGDYPTEIATSPDGNKVYVINSGSNTISVIDTAINNVTGNVSVGDGPSDIAVSPDGTNIYVTNWRSNNVSVINAATNNVTTTIPVGLTPFGVAITPDGKKVYVANSAIYSSGYEDNVSVIDTVTNKVTATVNTRKYTMNCPTGVVIGPSVRDGNESSKSNSIPGFGLFGSLVCLHAGQRLRKK